MKINERTVRSLKKVIVRLFAQYRLSQIFLLLLVCSISRAAVYPINVSFSGSAEVPSNLSVATGSFFGYYNSTTKTITFTINFTDLSSLSTSAHFHGPAIAGVNGPLILDFSNFPNLTRGSYSSSFVLTVAQEIQLVGGLWYSDIHTTDLQEGEIRAQIILGNPSICINNLPPVFTASTPCGQTLEAYAGNEIPIVVSSLDNNPNQLLRLNIDDFPFGPIDFFPLSNPFDKILSWYTTCANEFDDGLTTLKVSDNCGATTECTFIVRVLPSPDPFQNGIILDQNTVIDFRTPIPTLIGDADLLPFFSWEKNGATPDKWKAIFNFGSNSLLIKKGILLTLSQVNGFSPGIEINGNCHFKIENGGRILVSSTNRNSGNISITYKNCLVEGEIRNEVIGTLGVPGELNIVSEIVTIDKSGLIQILGMGQGGNTIALLAGIFGGGSGSEKGYSESLSRVRHPANTGGASILIEGLVKSYAQGQPGSSNRPSIKCINSDGPITILANTPEPLYDEFNFGGTKFDIWGGLLSWTKDNYLPGKVEVQSTNLLIVKGHGDDPTGPVRKSFGAISAISTSSDAPGGKIDVRVFGGEPNQGIVAENRAFDVSGRNRLKTNSSSIRLFANNDIVLKRTGLNSSFNPLLDASSPSIGDKGGTNEIRSLLGEVNIGTGVIISAEVPQGVGSEQGQNKIIWCTNLINNGDIKPGFINIHDCSGIVPPQFIANSELMSRNNTLKLQANEYEAKKDLKNEVFLSSFPNSFTQKTIIQYELSKKMHLELKILNNLGNEIKILNSETQSAGIHQIEWDAKNQSPGLYFICLTTSEGFWFRKLMLLK